MDRSGQKFYKNAVDSFFGKPLPASGNGIEIRRDGVRFVG